MDSIDPRINRLPKIGQPGQVVAKAPLDQFGTFEVFVQPKEGKPFQHEGAVHAPNIEMAYVLAKEAFTRRFTCTSLCVADTRSVYASLFTESNESAYDHLRASSPETGDLDSFEIYHLMKRGKQHVHATTVNATSPETAMVRAGESFKGKTVHNVWAIRTRDIRFTRPEDNDLWQTLPEKKFRDASDYKGGDKLKEYLERGAR